MLAMNLFINFYNFDRIKTPFNSNMISLNYSNKLIDHGWLLGKHHNHLNIKNRFQEIKTFRDIILLFNSISLSFDT